MKNIIHRPGLVEESHMTHVNGWARLCETHNWRNVRGRLMRGRDWFVAEAVFVVMCLASCTTMNEPPKDAAPTTIDAAPETCSAKLEGPTPIGGGNPYCNMTVTIFVTCPSGQSGHVFAVYGEAPSPTLVAASADVAYQCNVPVTLTRDGFTCSSSIAADVAWWSPDGTGPTTCQVTP